MNIFLQISKSKYQWKDILLEVAPVTSIEVTVVTWIEVNHRFEPRITSIEVTLAWQGNVTLIFNLEINLFSS